MTDTKTAARIIRRHYRLRRPVTTDEVADEVANLRRRGGLHLDDHQALLAAVLDLDLPLEESDA